MVFYCVEENTMIHSIKKVTLKLKNILLTHRFVILMSLPFFAMDIFTRAFGVNIEYFPAYYPVPNIFTILWVFLFMSVVTSLKGIAGRIVYWIFFALSLALFLTNTIYYSLTSFYFSFNLLQMAGEGSSYILDTIINANPIIYVTALLILIFAIIIAKKSPKSTNFHFKRLGMLLIIFIILHLFTPFLLGSENSQLKWNNFKNPRSVYESYSDSNKSLRVSGLYEYSFRNFYITFLKPKEKISEEDRVFLDNIYNQENTAKSDSFTGIFQGKNVIFLQLEGMDTWLLNKETTPNLYNLLNHSINFTDHYSIYTGGGSTFNSEFAVNTGFTTPISYTENVYTLNTNTFNNTMAKLFKKEGYTVNAFHMNSSDFYSRGINYKSWGYDNYYGLKDITDYNNLNYELDRELILNKTFYNKMFRQNGKFVDYIITYSPHTPFTTSKEIGQVIAENKYGVGNVPDLSEEETAKLKRQ
jgi:phosphoglycerol transferase MdoB-like AlkP superfamily enzyme